MKFYYDNISRGYLGLKYNNSNLNSAFYAEIIPKINNFNEKIVFPQRVPRSGFFYELYSLENIDFKKSYTDFIRKINLDFKKLIDKNSHKNEYAILNSVNMLMRYGQNEEILKHPIPKNLSLDIDLELQLLREMSKIEVNLSNGCPISLNTLIDVAEKINNSNVSDNLKMRAMNRVVVSSGRHSKKEHRDVINKFGKQVLNKLELKQAENFYSHILYSILYRGISMTDCFDTALKQDLLSKAKKHADSADWKTKEEEILYKDNMCTLLQTFSKWNTFLNKIPEAENNLSQMILIDPFDSAACTELGLFLFKLERFKEACIYFEKAVKLGPAGVGMNAYYYAKSLEHLGNEKDAIDAFYRAIEFDKNAISPFLDLIECYEKNGDKNKIQDISRQIMSNVVLKEQLEEDELDKISKLV